MGRAIHKRAKRWCACVGSDIAITPNTQADLQNVTRMGREMCSERRRRWLKWNTEKYSRIKKSSSCTRHQHHIHPIPFFSVHRTSRKANVGSFETSRQKKRRKHVGNNNKVQNAVGQNWAARADDVVEISTRTHTSTLLAYLMTIWCHSNDLSLPNNEKAKEDNFIKNT